MKECQLLIMLVLMIGSSHAQKKVLQFEPKDTLNSLQTTVAYRLACNYAIKKVPDSALYFIDYYLKYYGRKQGIVGILSSPEINNNLTDLRWKTMRSEMIKELRTYYGDTLNIPLFLRLLKYQNEDQYTRWKFISESKTKSPLGTVDSFNFQHLNYLDSLLSSGVVLNRYTVGEAGMEAIFLFIQHCQDSVRQRKYAKQVERWVTTGDIPKWSYAYYIDRQLISQKKPQIYGSQFWRNKERNELVLYPVERASELNKRRKQMGMPSIQYYLVNTEFLEGKKFNKESVVGMLKGNENLADVISKEKQQ